MDATSANISSLRKSNSIKSLPDELIQDDLFARIPRNALKEGYYSIIWCISPKHHGTPLLKNLVFEVEVGFMKYKLWAKLSEEQINSIDTSSGSIRLRLQQKLHLQFDGQISVRLRGELYSPLTEHEATTGSDDSFGVHYLELERLTSNSIVDNNDYIVESPGLKRQLLDIKSCLIPYPNDIACHATPMAQIFAIDVSASGSYVAVLSATISTAYLGIWDISKKSSEPPVVSNLADSLDLHRRSITTQPPVATATISLQDGDFDNMKLTRIAISSDGTNIAVYQQPREDDIAHEEDVTSQKFNFPFRLFRIHSLFSVVGVIQKSPDVKKIELVEDLTVHQTMVDFVGFGKFIDKERINPGISDPQSPYSDDNNPGDYFVACTESKILLYDSSNDWKRVYGIAIGGLSKMESRVQQLRTLFRSIEGPTFIWWEDLHNISIWDLVTGANRKYISVGSSKGHFPQNEIQHIAVSKNGGRILVIAGKDWIKSYFMDSGIEICGTVIGNGHRILDINFLDGEKSLLVTMGKTTSEQSSVIMDALSLSYRHCAKRQFASSTYSIQYVTHIPDNVGAIDTSGAESSGDGHQAILVVNGNGLEMLEIPQPGVIGISGELEECHRDCAAKGQLTLNNHVFQAPGSNITYRLMIDFEERDVDNRRQKTVRVALVSVDENKTVRREMSIVPEPWTQFDIDEGTAEDYIHASFLGSWEQFIIICSIGFQVWNLPDPSSNKSCELALAWVYPRSENERVSYGRYSEQMLEIRVCPHGEIIQPSWFNRSTGGRDTTQIHIPKSQWISQEETLHCINSLSMLNSCYYEASTHAQEAIVRYIVRYINSEVPNELVDYTVMARIARTARWNDYSAMLGAIFDSDDGKWIPRCSRDLSGGGIDGHNSKHMLNHGSSLATNPLVVLFRNSKKDPRSLSLAEQIIDYCIQQARLQCDPAFLTPALECLHIIVVHHPDVAISIVRRTAFIPVKDRRFVINNSMIAHSPHLVMETVSSMEFRRQNTPIYESPNSVFQLRSQLPRLKCSEFSSHVEVSKQKAVDPLNETFKRNVYVAPYSLLWHSRNAEWDNNGVPLNDEKIRNLSFEWNYPMMVVGAIVDKLNPRSRQTIRANFTDLQYFDNPAVEALLKYKWNSFAHAPWKLRFTGQLLYYALVLAVTFIQVYPDFPIIDLWRALVGIIVLGGLFVYLELQQFLADHAKYMRSPYNIVDVLVFLLPIVGSVQLLLNMQDESTYDRGNSRILSFSVLIVYIHLLFELRVVKSVCSIVTIILSIVGKIKIFLAIFALSVFAFTHSLLHLLMAQNHNCINVDGDGVQTIAPENCNEIDTDFPKNYIGALSTTYFIVAGRYDPLDKNLDSNDWAFHIMLATYFFVNVVIMLNILIALMNVAFSAGDDDAPLVWLDNRLRTVESAENISFAAPGLRERFDWFPQCIYYTASNRKIRLFEDKYPSRSLRDDSGSNGSVVSHVHDDSSSVDSDYHIDSDIYQLHSIQEVTTKLEPVQSQPSTFSITDIASTTSLKSPSLMSYASGIGGAGAYFSEAEPFTSDIPQRVNSRPLLRHHNSSHDRHLPSQQQQQQQQQQHPAPRRHRSLVRQETVRSINFLRGENDEDGDGIDDKFERDDEARPGNDINQWSSETR
ncbi:hypothetical protein BGZ76_006790 [Entomortierella beljakovae]|nr:hypothetical protein BGZ76_006790 [Entomortierella beljakovae]